MRWFLLVLLSLIWGSSYMLMKKGLQGFDFLEVGLLRSAMAGVFLLPFAVYHLFKTPIRAYLKPLALSILCGTVIPNILFAKAQTQLGGGMTGILNALSPLFILLIGIFLFKDKVKKIQVIGVLMGLVGCVGMLYFTKGVEGYHFGYSLIIVLVALMGSFNVQIIHHYLSNIKPVALASFTLTTAALFSTTYLLAQTDFMTQVQTPAGTKALGYLSILAILGSAISLILFNYLLSISNAVFASSITYLMPIVSIFWGVYDNEAFTVAHILGMLCILSGVYMVNAGKQTATTKETKL